MLPETPPAGHPATEHLPPDTLRRINASEVASHREAGASCTSFGPLHALSTGQQTPLDTAWHDGHRPPSPQEMQAFEDFCASAGQPLVLHALSDAAPPLLPLLREWGYALEYVLHVYAHPLHPLPEPPHLPVEPVPDPQTWATVSAQGFGPGSEAIMRLVAGHPRVQLYGVRLEGELAGTAALQVAAGVGALYGTSTRPEFRGRGVQAALLSYRLHAARQQGADLASVFVTPGTPSERNIRRAGFGLAGMRLTFRKE